MTPGELCGWKEMNWPAETKLHSNLTQSVVEFHIFPLQSRRIYLLPEREKPTLSHLPWVFLFTFPLFFISGQTTFIIFIYFPSLIFALPLVPGFSFFPLHFYALSPGDMARTTFRILNEIFRRHICNLVGPACKSCDRKIFHPSARVFGSIWKFPFS